MVTVHIQDKNLILEVQGFSKVFALRSTITVPLRHIRGATADSGVFDLPKGIRSPGTVVNQHYYAGTFISKGEKTFWNVQNQSKAIVIELEDNEEFNRLIVEVDKPEEAVALIERNIAEL